MIVNESELRASLGLFDAITNEERAMMLLLHPAAESEVRKYIGYDPEQSSKTEFYPRVSPAGGVGYRGQGIWDVNAAGTHAVFNRAAVATVGTSLQLQRLPVRSISELKVDYNGRFGKGANAFPSGSEWTEGEEYWTEYEETNVCMDGILEAHGSWPLEPGTIKITYRAGYSPDELAGRATTSATVGGVITTLGLSGIGLKQSVIITVSKAFQSWAANKKSARFGFLPGVLTSEKLGDYSYNLDPGAASAIAGLITALPGEAKEYAEPFVNWGFMRL